MSPPSVAKLAMPSTSPLATTVSDIHTRARRSGPAAVSSRHQVCATSTITEVRPAVPTTSGLCHRSDASPSPASTTYAARSAGPRRATGYVASASAAASMPAVTKAARETSA